MPMFKKKCRDSKNFDPTSFLNDLKDRYKDWTPRIIKNAIDVNDTFDCFCRIFKDTVNKHAPLRNLSRTERKRIERPWFTRGIQKSIETRQKY